MTEPIYIKANVDFLPPLLSETVALKLWQRLERNPCKDTDEQALYDALTKRFFTLASVCFITTEETTPEKP